MQIENSSKHFRPAGANRCLHRGDLSQGAKRVTGNRSKNRGFHSRQPWKRAIKPKSHSHRENPLTDWNRANFWYQDSPELYSPPGGSASRKPKLRVEARKPDPGNGSDGPERPGEGMAAGCSNVQGRCARSLTFVRQGKRVPRGQPRCSEIDTRWPRSGSGSPTPSSSY